MTVFITYLSCVGLCMYNNYNYYQRHRPISIFKDLIQIENIYLNGTINANDFINSVDNALMFWGFLHINDRDGTYIYTYRNIEEEMISMHNTLAEENNINIINRHNRNIEQLTELCIRCSNIRILIKEHNINHLNHILDEQNEIYERNITEEIRSIINDRNRAAANQQSNTNINNNDDMEILPIVNEHNQIISNINNIQYRHALGIINTTTAINEIQQINVSSNITENPINNILEIHNNLNNEYRDLGILEESRENIEIITTSLSIPIFSHIRNNIRTSEMVSINRQITQSLNTMLEIEADINHRVEEVIRQLREVNIIEQIQTAIPPQQRLEDLELHRDTNMTLNNAINRGKYIAIFIDRISKPKK